MSERVCVWACLLLLRVASVRPSSSQTLPKEGKVGRDSGPSVYIHTVRTTVQYSSSLFVSPPPCLPLLLRAHFLGVRSD